MNKTSTKVLASLIAVFIVALFPCGAVLAQCLPINITGTSTSAANCPSSGGITITATGTGLTYRLTSGPVGYSTASNSTGVFNTLIAGNYTVEVADGCGATTTRNLTVANTYPVFSVSSASLSNVCTNGTSGGTITANVTGGTPPYQYDIVPVASSPSFGSSTASSSYIETVNSFATYRVYAKDACGEVRTYDVMINPTQPRAFKMSWNELKHDRPCAETMDGLPTITWKIHLRDQNTLDISMKALAGATYQVYKPAVANSIPYSENNCTTATGTLLTSGTILAANIPADDTTAYPIIIPKEDVILIITNTCGQTFKYCYDFNEGAPSTPDAQFSLIQQSCSGGVWINQVLKINLKYTENMGPVLTYLLTKAGGQTITNNYGSFSGLTPADFPLSIKITDECGVTVTKNFNMPVQGSGLQFSVYPEWQLLCTNTKNTATAQIKVTGGDLPGIGDATNITITGGTVTAVPVVSAYSEWLPGYYVSNLLAGYTYKVIITNLCGEKDSLQFTVPTDHWGQPVLNWNLTTNVNALCGQNKSTIVANSGFTGTALPTFNLYNLISPNTVIATNEMGIFENVAPGNYKVKFVVTSPAWACTGKDIKDSINVSVLADGAGQTITRKTVTTCEVGGVPTTAGKALIEVSGSGPFTYEIIKNSLVGTAFEVWTVSSTNNPSNTYMWDIPLAGDPSNTVYSFRTTDKCGNKVTTQASLQPINPPAFVAQNNPCIGTMNYTVTLNDYGGDFTYRWVRLPDLATTLSTSNSITFPGAYTAINNGTYRCYIDLAGCIQRYADVTINSNQCGSLLPVKLLYFTGIYVNKQAQLKWVAENETNFGYYEIERSSNGRNFERVDMVPSRNISGAADYAYTDDLSTYTVATVYYRLKIKDKDGRFSYSPVVRLNIANGMEDITIYPNPVQNTASIIFTSDIAGTALMKITDKTGRTIVNDKITVQKGNNAVKLPGTENLIPATYILQVQTAAGIKAIKFTKL